MFHNYVLSTGGFIFFFQLVIPSSDALPHSSVFLAIKPIMFVLNQHRLELLLFYCFLQLFFNYPVLVLWFIPASQERSRAV